jgi:acyl dehydratase
MPTPRKSTLTDAGTLIMLDKLPSLTPLLARAAVNAFPLPGRGDDAFGVALPKTGVRVRDVAIDPDHVAAYADVCGFSLGNDVPVTYPHMLGFPLSVMLMTRPDFPFGLMGLVHIANHITRRRPLALNEQVGVTAGMTNLRPHPKGQQLDNVVTVTAAGEVVWQSVSTYLARGAGSRMDDRTIDDREGSRAEPQESGTESVDVAALPLTSRWRVRGDIGRRYARVSGDRNPIHLSGPTAKAFGFPRAIAHGMWTKARCLAALQGELAANCHVDVAFKLPLFLPSTVEYATKRRPEGWAFGVRGTDGKPHLAGVVQEGSAPLG